MRKTTETKRGDRVWVGERSDDAPDRPYDWVPEYECIELLTGCRFEFKVSDGSRPHYLSVGEYDDFYAVPDNGDRVKIEIRRGDVYEGVFYDDLEDLDNDESTRPGVHWIYFGKPGVNTDRGTFSPWENVAKFEVIDKADKSTCSMNQELEQLLTKAAEIDQSVTIEVADVDFDSEFDGLELTVHVSSVTYNVVVGGQTIGQVTLDEDDIDALNEKH